MTTKLQKIAAACAHDFGRFAYDGFGVMLSDEQLEVRMKMGPGGPRKPLDPKFTFISGGQRSGKTVFLGLSHADANLYKRGVDNTDGTFWRNYMYKTLAVAPSDELALKLWIVMDELSKGASDAQFDRRARRARGGAFLGLLRAGKAGRFPVVRYEYGSETNFRSTEGWATRLEGDQWWYITWDEWASQPDREIEFVRTDVLMGRARDHDAKVVLAAWPKAATERHLMRVIRDIEAGRGNDFSVVFLRADKAHFTNQDALEVERRTKDPAQWKRTVLGEPAGGASVEFPHDVIRNMVNRDLPFPVMPQREDARDYRFFHSWDLGMGHDDTVGITWRVPRAGVTPKNKTRIVNIVHMPANKGLTVDRITFAITREQETYHGDTAVDGAGLGGVGFVRALRDLRPPPISFVARSNDRIHGNMRIAALVRGLEMLTWGRPAGDPKSEPWGMVECPEIPELLDQLANYDRDDRTISDDFTWAFLIGLWYIRAYWVRVDEFVGKPRTFDPRIASRQSRPFLRRVATR